MNLKKINDTGSIKRLSELIAKLEKGINAIYLYDFKELIKDYGESYGYRDQYRQVYVPSYHFWSGAVQRFLYDTKNDKFFAVLYWQGDSTDGTEYEGLDMFFQTMKSGRDYYIKTYTGENCKIYNNEINEAFKSAAEWLKEQYPAVKVFTNRAARPASTLASPLSSTNKTSSQTGSGEYNSDADSLKKFISAENGHGWFENEVSSLGLAKSTKYGYVLSVTYPSTSKLNRLDVDAYLRNAGYLPFMSKGVKDYYFKVSSK